MIRIILLLTLVASVLSVCPRFETVTNLSPPQFAGKWNIHGLIRNVGGDPRIMCLEADLTSNDWVHEPVSAQTNMHGKYQDSGETFEQSAPATIPSFTWPGRWTIDLNGTQVEYAILKTDYLEFALSVSCVYRVEDDIDEINVFFMSRKYDAMPPSIINNYIGSLNDDYKIDTSLYYDIYQNEAICNVE